MDIPTLERQETDLRFATFDAATALDLGMRLVALGRKDALPICINIRTATQTLFHAALPGAVPLNDLWAQRKSAVVLQFQESSLLVGERMRAKSGSFEANGLDPLAHAAHGGSFPLRLTSGFVFGAVTVSGLPQREDHALVVTALRDLLGQ
jgi:uncharacterized protein (UPF0303 family)